MSKRKKRQDPLKESINRMFVKAAAAEAAKRVTQICPIYRPKTAMEPELFATGVFVVIGHRRFVLTAAHVFGPAAEGHRELHIPSHSTGNLTELIGTYVRSKPSVIGGTDDLNDVGIVLLEDSLAAQINADSFVKLDSFDVDDIGDFQRPYLAMGYPWRVSPKVKRRERSVVASPRSYADNLLKHEHLHKLGLRPETHFFLRYFKRHTRTEFGRDVTAPDPDGMSGGPLWRIEPTADSGQSSHLVGIIIKWHRQPGGLLVIRLPVVLAAIEQFCPDIASLIPQTRTLAIEITSPPLEP